MAFVDVADQRWPDLERAIGQLAQELQKVREQLFSLISHQPVFNVGFRVVCEP